MNVTFTCALQYIKTIGPVRTVQIFTCPVKNDQNIIVFVVFDPCKPSVHMSVCVCVCVCVYITDCRFTDSCQYWTAFSFVSYHA